MVRPISIFAVKGIGREGKGGKKYIEKVEGRVAEKLRTLERSKRKEVLIRPHKVRIIYGGGEESSQ